MKLASILFATTALLPSVAFAQAQNDCDLLLVELDRRQGQELSVTRDEVMVFAQRSDFAACRAALQDIQTAAAQPREGAADTGIVVQQPAPVVTVDQVEPQITVQQPQPQVTVRQPQPEILVRQPAPVVSIDIPQPEIIVRMPQPEVAVQQGQPLVNVEQPQPQVEVVQREQPQVRIADNEAPVVRMEPSQGQANVQFEQIGEPQVRYERAEPQVTVNQPQGQPQVRFEQMQGAAGQPNAGAEMNVAGPRDSIDADRTAERREGAAAGEQQATLTQEPAERREGAAAGEQQATLNEEPAAGQPITDEAQTQRISVADLEGMDAVNLRGQQIGDVEGLVQSTVDNKLYVVIDHGGFLGLGEKRIALSLEGMQLQGDRLIVPGVSDEDIRAYPEFRASEQFPRLDDNAMAEITVAQQ